MQFEVVRFVVGSQTNIDQSPTDIEQTLLDAATVKGHCEIIRFFVFPAMKTMWVDLRRPLAQNQNVGRFHGLTTSYL